MEPTVSYNLLFIAGVALMLAAAAAAVAAFVFLRVSGRRLRKQLDQEYGKKRR